MSKYLFGSIPAFLLGFLLVLIVLPPNRQHAQSTTTTINYTASNENFPNPERGFFDRELTDSASPSLMWPDKFQQLKSQKMTLLALMFNLTTFRKGPISSSYLQHIQQQFDLARNNGIKLIVRFAYTFNEPGSHEDAPLSVVQGHIDQLAPLLQKNSDVIAIVDEGFIGRWGEGHTSSNGLDTSAGHRAVVTKLLSALPKDRMVGVRRQRIKKEIYNNTNPLTPSEAFNGTDRARTGAFNDCFLAGYEDWGTYEGPPWPVPADMIESQKDWLNQDNRYVPQTGETCNPNPPRSDCQTALAELKRMRWSALNADYHMDVLNPWKSQGCYSEIEKKLGYRYRLVQASIPTQVSSGGNFSMSFQIVNDGYASTYNPRNVELILRNKSNGNKHVIKVSNADPRFWLPGQAYTINVNATLPSNLTAGNYDLLLNLPDPYASLATRPEYSIRLANMDTWETATGYNSLLHSLQVATGGTTSTPTPIATPTPSTGTTTNGTGLKGEYFNNRDFTNLKLTRTDATINFSWGTSSPASGIGADTFSVRWTGQVQAPVTGAYTFTTRSDDGVRLWVNNQQLVNNWTNHAPTDNSGTISLTAGQRYSIKMEYYENTNGAVAQLSWSYPGQFKQIIPQKYLYPTASTPIVNLLANAGFEADGGYADQIQGWITWTGTNNQAYADYVESYGGAHGGTYHGTHWANVDYYVQTNQYKTGLANGLYTMKAWVKNGGGQKYAVMYAWSNSQGLIASMNIPVTSSWTQITLLNINVIGGDVQVGFESDAYAGNWIHFDTVEFYKQ